jgi:alcohol dehydrogenase (NADP+)
MVGEGKGGVQKRPRPAGSGAPRSRERRRIMGSLVGGLPQTQEMLDHCGDHGITSDIERITPSQIHEAFDRAVRGEVKYRFVIDCTKF